MTKKIVTDDGEIIDAPIASTKPLFFKTAFNHDTLAAAQEGALVCKDESRTQQQFAKDADINVILAKFMETGDQTIFNVRTPNYMDIDEEYDLQSRIVTSYEVEQAWKALPVAVQNILKSPKVFVDYVQHCFDTGDLDPLRELGLADAAPVKTKEEPAATSSQPAGTPAAGGETAAPAAGKAT